ncbi:MAG: DNA-binding protein [Lentisphaeria bacterium]|jgi:RHH-type rel operon transcriptional repressor/antitoxin RelB
MSVTISVRLPNELAQALADVSIASERSKSFVMQKALEAYLEEQADLQISLDRLNAPTDAVISLEAMRSKLGL